MKRQADSGNQKSYFGVRLKCEVINILIGEMHGGSQNRREEYAHNNIYSQVGSSCYLGQENNKLKCNTSYVI